MKESTIVKKSKTHKTNTSFVINAESLSQREVRIESEFNEEDSRHMLSKKLHTEKLNQKGFDYYQTTRPHTRKSKRNKTAGKLRTYDNQELFYEIGRDYFNMRIDTDKDFLTRMAFDSYKRSRKEETIKKLVSKKKMKIADKVKNKAFERLITDSMRRSIAKTNMDKVIADLEQSTKPKEEKKGDFDTFYARELRFKKESELKLKEKRENKERDEEEQIDKIIKSVKVVKKPKIKVTQIINRLYDAAEIRDMKLEKKKQEDEEEKLKKLKKLETDPFFEVLNKKAAEIEVKAIVARLTNNSDKKIKNSTFTVNKQKKKGWIGVAAEEKIDSLFKAL